ncbi:hypothetical protein [Chengkuizengella sediminis]|uniref:hypothetical protein n=1 Tax=Chengkuizengella sediminis TaxID=1885917 RepID=UPI0013893BDF|nr:hypothetical protein [Chengkuizengella sediminis]NDI36667.1 hypothetical protein [Chengkuizengella sediminis]
MGKMSLTEAKKFFKSMQCSKFVMAREELMKYEMYMALKISKETEMKWREEEFYRYYKSLNDDKHNNEKLWLKFDRMYDLIESTKNIDHILKMHSIIKVIMSKLSDIERIIIAETINGRSPRSVRSGLIYLSYDLGEENLTKSFINDCMNLLEVSTDDEELKNRAERAKQLCNEIKNGLKL